MKYPEATGRVRPADRPEATHDLSDVVAVKGYEGKILPAFPTAYHDFMPRPVTSTVAWLGRFGAVNSFFGYHFKSPEASGVQVVDFKRPTADLGINHLLLSYDAKEGYEEVRLLADNDENVLLYTSEADLSSPFEPNDPRYRPHRRLVAGEASTLYDSQMDINEAGAQSRLQPLVQSVLQDLGYGNPADFAERAVPYTDLR